MKKRKSAAKKKLGLWVCIALIILIGISIALCVAFGSAGDWIRFSVCLALALVMSAVAIPLGYHGTTYECPKCGHKFKANPYKVFFTNGIFGIFDFGGYGSKYAKLECPECKTKDFCKKHYE